MEIEALKIAADFDIDDCEALLTVETGANVSTMTSKEIKRDTIVFARNNPQQFLELVHDEALNLKSLGMKAVQQGIIKMSPDGRSFVWAKNSKKLMVVPFDQEPYPALAAWFKTDDGMKVLESVQKKIK